MSRKIKFLLILVPAVFLLLVLTLYLSLAFYYREGFSYGTWINGVYCTGKGIEEINSELKTKYVTTPVIIRYGEEENTIDPASVDMDIDFTAYLTDILNNQNSFLWIKNLFGNSYKTDIEPAFSYDSDKLSAQISDLSIVKNHKIKDSYVVRLEKKENGFELTDTKEDGIDIDILSSGIKEALCNNSDVTIDDSFLITCDYTENEKKIIECWNNSQEFFDTKIILDMGTEQIPIDKSVLSRFVSVDSSGLFIKENDAFVINREEVDLYVDELLDQYDTYKETRDFYTTDGETKTIDLIMYGTLTDHDDLKEYLYNALINETVGTYTPKYLKEAYVKGLNDIGDTYVEVDMGKQILYYYKNGELLLKTDIVTGKPSTMTPAMITAVSSKSRDVVLRGTNYASPVKYWVPIYPKMGIGLHDASWQKKFGSDVYLTRGSHGCINMITEDIAFLYDELEIGMPVICYY